MSPTPPAADTSTPGHGSAMSLTPTRRRMLGMVATTIVCTAGTVGVLSTQEAEAAEFSFDQVLERARQLAAQPYQPYEPRVPREVRELGYDAYRDIRFKPDRALWRADKLPFELMFFHPGAHYGEPVRLNEVAAGVVRPIPYDPADFDLGRNKFDAQALRGGGFAGFRVHYPINRAQYKDEVLVFLGASYFRAIGKGQVYGMSGRGLALDTAEASGEEFPRFVEFWIERPTADAKVLRIHALMDSRRVSGAYRFDLTPGGETLLDVHSVLVPREPLRKAGLAPLTSMYFFGENQPGRDDYRPEVHDSDGLSVHTGAGQWIWRPLVNPSSLLVTSFAMKDPKGFGLMQRDRAHGNYEDPEALYDLRPSAWVEPAGAWGEGRVELVQIPTADETNDNIVAYWVPAQPLPAGQPTTLDYRMRWQSGEHEVRPPDAWVVQTRRGRGYVREPDGNLKFVVDFDGPALRKLADDARLSAKVQVAFGDPKSSARLVEQNLFRNRATGTWRLTVRVDRKDAERPLELSAALRLGDAPVGETWSYIVPAEPMEKP